MNKREWIEMMRQSRPEPSKDFAARIDRELVWLQNGKDAKRMKCKMPMAALVAIIIALLTAFGAIAATVAGNMLGDKLKAGGAGDAAKQVKDVHAGKADAGFGFTVEQCYWEGGTLCFSYTATVPEDGRHYLLGLEMPALNGERLRGDGFYMDDELSGSLILLGGAHMTTLSEIRRVTAYASQVKDAGNKLAIRACFMTPERPVKWVSGEQYQRLLGEGLYTDALPEDGCFYINSESELPVLGLAELKPVQEYWHEQEANGTVGVRLTDDDLADLGLVGIEKAFEVTVDVDDARYDGQVYRGLEDRSLQFDGFSVEISRFELSHLNCSINMTVTPDDGVDIADVPTDFALCLPDGSPLMADGRDWVCFAWKNTSEDGSSFFSVHCEATGILATGRADSFLLVPRRFDEKAMTYVPDPENAVRITPTQEQFRDNPDAMWATPKGNYYHRDRYCMGMEGAEQTTAEAAEAAGKQPCLICVK